MTVPNTLGSRLMGLDQARAVAVLAMLAAHFAPGVFDRVPALEPARVPVFWFARLATPTFMVVFGVTAGFVLVPRYGAFGPGPTAGRLRQRAALVLACAVAITLPRWARLAATAVDDPWAWLFGLYSVLFFYALALALLPAWLRWLGRRPAARAVPAGAALWALGTAGHALWPQGPPSLPEFARMMLVSGSYAYMQMMGTALVALPVGVGLRRAWEAGAERPVLVRVLIAGPILAGVGGLWGWAAGEYDPARILSGNLRNPPRAWYFLHFGGAGLTLVPALELLTRTVRRLGPVWYVLALFGQAGLVLFTGHAFVLPALAAADHVAPVHGAARVAWALAPFVIFCVVVLGARHRQLVGRAARAVVNARGDGGPSDLHRPRLPQAGAGGCGERPEPAPRRG